MGQFGVLEALLHLGPMCQRTIGEKLVAQRRKHDAGDGQSRKARLGAARAAEGRPANDREFI